MALVNFTNLDFDQIKSSIREYLRANSNFTDYDFEGSNLSVLIDTLAYNTYISSYNANMISNEIFIDSATLRENVVSLARNIGYVPRSRTASRANISFFVDVTPLSTNPTTLTLKKGVVCATNNSFANQSFTFTIPQDITVPVVNGIGFFQNIEIFEGTFVTQNFTVDANNPNQKFILSNSGIDTDSISVVIRNTQSSSIRRIFNKANSLVDDGSTRRQLVNENSKVFFLQEIEDQRYELLFGDGVFGKKLDNLNYIEVSYIITSGEPANGVSNFTYNGRIVDNNGRVVNSGISLVTTNSVSRSGKEIESVASIKKFAPRIYSSQNRAVTSTDYESIIPLLYPEAESISVFGGEDLSPPKYGKVFISIKPINGPFVSSQVKDNLKFSLRKYAVAGIVPEIIDLKYLYIEANISAYYNSNMSISANSVKNVIFDNINKYSDSSELNKFGARFKYSKFLKIIDDSHDSVTSNITKITIRRDLRVSTNKFADYEICYGNKFHINNTNGYNIKSSGFNISGLNTTLYFSDLPNSDGRTGTLFLFRLDSETQPIIVRRNIGKIDYEKGEIFLFPINIVSTVKSSGDDPIIQISATPKSNDVIGLQDLYLQLDINNSIVNVVSDDISSGADISGSSYTVTSSYNNGNLVRY
jgi:hypothetical protein